jgi:carboxyl-terminal processing protease
LVRTLARGVLSSVAATALAAVATAAPPLPDAGERRADAAALCTAVTGHYAYLAAKATDWDAACGDLAERAGRATTRDAFVAALEHALRELYDAHAHLGTHVQSSPRLVPSQTDVLARFVDGKPVVEAVRAGSAAQRAGATPDQEILSINGVAVDDALRPYLPAHLARPDPAARDFALRVALAGRHDEPVQRLTVRADSGERTVAFAASRRARGHTLSVRQDGGVAIVRINDALGDDALVRHFDTAVDSLRDARALVLDLTDTPSGGNSTVARGILGRFVGELAPYQRHELVGEAKRTGVRRHWVEHVAPRPPRVAVPVVVLVGPWTGSMGEGLAIGFHAAAGAVVVGRPMAKLAGALDEFVLPHSRIVVRFATEQLFHVDGTAREAFVPCPADIAAASTPDLDARELDFAVRVAAALAVAPAAAPHAGCPSRRR